MCVSKFRILVKCGKTDQEPHFNWFWSNLFSECFSLMNLSYLRCIPVVAYQPNNTVTLLISSTTSLMTFHFPLCLVLIHQNLIDPDLISLRHEWDSFMICPKVQFIAVGNGASSWYPQISVQKSGQHLMMKPYSQFRWARIPADCLRCLWLSLSSHWAGWYTICSHTSSIIKPLESGAILGPKCINAPSKKRAT